MMAVGIPYAEMIFTFDRDKEKTCIKCYEDIVDACRQWSEANKLWYQNNLYIWEVDTVDCCGEGWYFTVFVSLKYPELIGKISEKLLVYKEV